MLDDWRAWKRRTTAEVAMPAMSGGTADQPKRPGDLDGAPARVEVEPAGPRQLHPRPGPALRAVVRERADVPAARRRGVGAARVGLVGRGEGERRDRADPARDPERAAEVVRHVERARLVGDAADELAAGVAEDVDRHVGDELGEILVAGGVARSEAETLAHVREVAEPRRGAALERVGVGAVVRRDRRGRGAVARPVPGARDARRVVDGVRPDRRDERHRGELDVGAALRGAPLDAQQRASTEGRRR